MEGVWSRYNENPTIWQKDYNRQIGRLTEEQLAGVLIAHADCGLAMAGTKVWIQVELPPFDDDVVEYGPWEEGHMFDCAGSAETLKRMEREEWLGEVDWYTALRYGFTHYGVVRGRMSYERP